MNRTTLPQVGSWILTAVSLASLAACAEPETGADGETGQAATASSVDGDAGDGEPGDGEPGDGEPGDGDLGDGGLGEGNTNNDPVASCVVLDVDFSASPLGPYNPASIAADFEHSGNKLLTYDPQGWKWTLDESGNAEHARIVEDNGNRVLRLTLGDLGVHPNRAFMIELGNSLEAAVLRYRFKTTSSVAEPFRGPYKIPRLAGRRAGLGEYLHVDPDPDGPGGTPTTGYTASMQFYGNSSSYRSTATPSLYVYHADQPQAGKGQEIYFPTSARIKPNQWHDVELYVRMNTRGCTNDCDGVFAIRFDGQEIYRSESWRFSDTEDLDINRFFFLAQSNKKSQLVDYLYFDDFVVECVED